MNIPPTFTLQPATASPSLTPAPTHTHPRASHPPGPITLRFASGGNDDRPTIDVERRRRDDSSGNRERADAPHRRRDDASSPPPTSGSSSGGGWTPPSLPSTTSSGGGGGSIPGGMSGVGVIVLLIIIAVVYFLFQGGTVPTDDNNPDNNNPQPAVVSTPTRLAVLSTPRPTRTPGGPDTGDKWLVMLYQDADDQSLEQDIFVDMNEAERAGSDDHVQVVSQLDRYKGAFSGDGNWTGARRYYITKDDDLSKINSKMVGDLGEVDMSDPNTLVDFATWAINTYPADKYVLILSDHGMGWPGGWTDPTSDNRSLPNVPLASAVDNQMFLSDIDTALTHIRSNTGLDKFELVGLDACLMSSLEVLDALAPSARYAVTSQETEPSLGWAYTSFLDSLKSDPTMNGGDLAQDIVASYIKDDQRIVDDQARNDFVRGNSLSGGLFGGAPSADQVSQQLSRDVTLTAVDLGALPQLTAAVNDLAFDFQKADQHSVSQARQYAQRYTNVFGDNSSSPYIDLGNFLQLLKQKNPSATVSGQIDNVTAAIGQVVLSEKHGADKPGATGISIYFPTSQLYRSPVSGPQSYTGIANRFASDSLWDNFLTYFYTGHTFEKSPSVVGIPGTSDTVAAPAAGVQVSALTASAQEVSIGQTVTLSADVTGQNVGYIKLFTGYLDESANSIDIVDMDYLESSNTRQVNGVYYPDWGSDAFTVRFKWDPIVFGITDGTDTVQALLTPQTYGASSADAIYTVDGTLTFANGSPDRYARLYFRDGALQQVMGFDGQDGTGAASAINPQNGDKFTIYEKWMDLDSNGSVTQIASQAGDTLTFGSQSFTWKSLDAAAGQYVVGFLVQDLDGNPYPTYATITVR